MMLPECGYQVLPFAPVSRSDSLRTEFLGVVSCVTSRGDRREPIFRDDGDREKFLDMLDHTLERLDAQVLTNGLMVNHYHLVLQTRSHGGDASLRRRMRVARQTVIGRCVPARRDLALTVDVASNTLVLLLWDRSHASHQPQTAG